MNVPAMNQRNPAFSPGLSNRFERSIFKPGVSKALALRMTLQYRQDRQKRWVCFSVLPDPAGLCQPAYKVRDVACQRPGAIQIP